VRYSINEDYIRFSIDDDDDLYIVYLLLDRGDVLYGWTTRELRGRDNGRGDRLKIYVGLRIEAMEYHAFRGNLRVRGRITEAPEWFEGALGSYHTVEIMKGLEYTVVKNKMNKQLIERIMGMFNRSSARVFVISISDEELAMAMYRRFGIEDLGTIRNKHSHGKIDDSAGLKKFVRESLPIVRNRVQSRSPTHIVITGPYMILELCREELAEVNKWGIPVITHPQGSGGLAGIYEFQSSGAELLRSLNIDLGQSIIEEILRRLGSGSGDVALGLSNVNRALELGAVDTLVILDDEYKELGEEARRLAALVVETGAGLIIIPSTTNLGERLRGIGGVAALLRYPLETP